MVSRTSMRITNRVQGLWAPWLPPWALIVHKGRTSGREYHTPVMAWRLGDRFAIMLFFGQESDWVRNVLAAGGAEVRRAHRVRRLTEPRVVAGADAGFGAVL